MEGVPDHYYADFLDGIDEIEAQVHLAPALPVLDDHDLFQAEADALETLVADPVEEPPSRPAVSAQDAPPKAFKGRTRYFCVTIWDPLFTVNDADQTFVSYVPGRVPLIAAAAVEYFQARRLGWNFFIFQLERCPTTNHLHLQSYIEMINPTAYDTLRTHPMFDGTCGTLWIQKARGSSDENIHYCTKDDSCVDPDVRFQLGEAEFAGQGRRNDIRACKRKIDEGIPIVDIWRNDNTFEPMLKFHRGFNEYRLLTIEPNWVQRNIIVYWGDAGTGKSYTAKTRFEAREGKVFFVPHPKGSGLYFDKYDCEETILFEEFTGARCSLSFLLDLCGDGPCQLPVHGGSIQLSAKTVNIVFTSDSHPGHWYSKLFESNPRLWPMLERRIAELHHRTERYNGEGIIIRNWPVPPPRAPGGVPNSILHHDSSLGAL